MSKNPDALIFSCGHTTLRFDYWHMAYGKGAAAGIQIISKNKIGDTREVDDADLFSNRSHVTVEMRELLGNMNYKDLIDLAKWATNAAEFVKKAEVKYRGKKQFDEESNNNNLRLTPK